MERKEDATIQDNAIRPRALKDYIGQETIKKNLNIYECSKRQVGTIGSRPTLWSAWAWEDDACRNYRK